MEKGELSAMRPVSAFVLCLLLNVASEVCRAGEGGLQTLQVTDVSENSATLHWDGSASKLAKGQLKLVCTGSSVFTVQSGAQHVSYSTSTQVTPRNINTLSLSGLHPNTNYTCIVIYEDHDVKEVYSNSAHFCTDYSEPSPPPAPLVLRVTDKQQQNQSVNPFLLQLDLLPASTKYGPVHGYELQFFVVLPHEAKSGKIKHPIQHQLGLPYGTQNSLQDATSATEAVNFAYQMYKSGYLPARVNISTSLVGGSLKQNTTYSAVLLAYTNDTAHKRMLLSYSPFSKFFFIPAYHVPGVVSQFREVYREALISIVFGSALPVLAVVGFVLLTVALGWKIRKKRNSKYYRKQLLRPVFKWPHMWRTDEGREEDHRRLLEEASDSEEQLSPLQPAPSQPTHPSTQTSEAGAVCSQEKTEEPCITVRPSHDAYGSRPAGNLKKGSVVGVGVKHGVQYTNHTASKCASRWLNKCRQKSTSVKYTKLTCTSNSSDSEDEGERESRPPPTKRPATQILTQQTIETSTPANHTFENDFPNALVHAPVKGGAVSDMEPQAGVDIDLGKGGMSVELQDDLLVRSFLRLQAAAAVQLPSESEQVESGVSSLSSAKKFDLLSHKLTKHLRFHPYSLVDPAGLEQLCPVKAEGGDCVAGYDHVYELAKMYNRQYCGTDSVTNGGKGTVDCDHCELQVKKSCSAQEWDLGDIMSPKSLSPRLSADSHTEECPQFSPTKRDSCSVPGQLESDSSLAFPPDLSVPCIVRDCDPSLLHLPSVSESGELEGTMSVDSFTFKQPLMHSSGIVLPDNDPTSPPAIPRPPSGARTFTFTPLRSGSQCPGLGLTQPQKEGLLLLLERGDTDTPEANASSASFDLSPVPSDVEICSRITLVGPSSSSDQVEHL